MKKVMIIGSSGAGKSFFSQELAQKTKLPLYHLDQMFWQPGWKEPNKQIFRQNVADLAKTEQWIIDGNYGSTIKVRAEQADTIIFLDYPRLICLWQCLRRLLKDRLLGQLRPDITTGCREKLSWSFLVWIWTYPSKGRRRALDQIKEAGFPLEKIIFFKTKKDKHKFLESLHS